MGVTSVALRFPRNYAKMLQNHQYKRKSLTKARWRTIYPYAVDALIAGRGWRQNSSSVCAVVRHNGVALIRC